MRKIIIGVIGPGESATAADLKYAYELGQRIARQGWVLLTGGRKSGVMDAASQGAKVAGGLTIGILPRDNTRGISEAVDIAIITDMGNARNNINVLSCDLVIACGMATGTASEVALALKSGKKVVLLTQNQATQIFFKSLSPDNILVTNSLETTIEFTKEVVNRPIPR
ncbi:MAG: TIGR00725 family protein [Symploca sp. SIO3C6]|uniref:TIGR00725 family protein n=1 Tax=Symploca sp. SIO1C4 TaxID=2607765 RepID=A0A6B3NR10_9CYAN|nr:TIGR00725 family protein [Symploca sp. SIO3C6]NER31668.1 TIGR00725 family protein [Symploca sp. SIO1C4]NET04315.1 TIGR00725 family protein [Symploca sp. SIO2B6]